MNCLGEVAQSYEVAHGKARAQPGPIDADQVRLRVSPGQRFEQTMLW